MKRFLSRLSHAVTRRIFFCPKIKKESPVQMFDPWRIHEVNGKWELRDVERRKH